MIRLPSNEGGTNSCEFRAGFGPVDDLLSIRDQIFGDGTRAEDFFKVGDKTRMVVVRDECLLLFEALVKRLLAVGLDDGWGVVVGLADADDAGECGGAGGAGGDSG